MNIRILVLFIATIVFTGGCATNTPYPVAHTHVAQNGATVQQQQIMTAQQQSIYQQPIYRQQVQYGLQPSKPGLMRAFDESVGSGRAVLGLIREYEEIQRLKRFPYFGGHQIIYPNFNLGALMPAILRNAEVCDIARRQGHIWGHC